MQNRWAVCLVAGAASLGLGCPNEESTLLGAPTTSPTGSTSEETGLPTSGSDTTPHGSDGSTTADGSEGSTTPQATEDSGAPPGGLMVVLTPPSPRSGSTAQLSATLDGSPVEVTWELLGGPPGAVLGGDGSFEVPQAAGTWQVEATLAGDPQQTATGNVVADFRGGRPVQGWGNADEGTWLYPDSYGSEWPGALVVGDGRVYGAIRRTDLGNYTVLVGLEDATGDPLQGFGKAGLTEFMVPGEGKLATGWLGLASDRLWLAGGVGLEGALAAASPFSGQPVQGFGYYQSGLLVTHPTPDPSFSHVYIGTGSLDTAGVERLTKNGDLDAGWGDAGALAPKIPASWQDVWSPSNEALTVRDLDVDPDGRLYVLLQSREQGSNGVVAALLRYTEGGAPDPAFGLGGAIVWALNNEAGTAAKAMRVAQDGAIYVVGDHYGRWFGTRITGSGKIDLDYGSKGSVYHEYKRGIGMAAQTSGIDVEVLPGGHAVYLVDYYPATTGCGLVRFDADGVVNTDFGDVEANGDGWSLLWTVPHALGHGDAGRVFVMGQDIDRNLGRNVRISALHTY